MGLGSLLFTAAIYDLLLAPFTVPLIMALARRTENDPLAEASSGGNDVAAGWLASGTGLRIGNQRGGLRVKAARTAPPARAGSRGSSACEAEFPGGDPRTPSRTIAGGTP